MNFCMHKILLDI